MQSNRLIVGDSLRSRIGRSGESLHLGEMAAEARVVCRRFLLPSRPRQTGALQAEASSGESTAIEMRKYAGRTGMIVWIAFDLVYILSLYAIIFSLHSILKAPLARELPRDRDKENLPVLLF